MEGEGYEQRDHQIHYWVITDLPGIEDRDAGVVKDALYESFRPLDNVKDSNPECSQKYGKDAAHVFYRGHVIEGADLSTFEIIQSDYSLYAKDKGAVYLEGNASPTACSNFAYSVALGTPRMVNRPFITANSSEPEILNWYRGMGDWPRPTHRYFTTANL